MPVFSRKSCFLGFGWPKYSPLLSLAFLVQLQPVLFRYSLHFLHLELRNEAVSFALLFSRHPHLKLQKSNGPCYLSSSMNPVPPRWDVKTWPSSQGLLITQIANSTVITVIILPNQLNSQSLACSPRLSAAWSRHRLTLALSVCTLRRDRNRRPESLLALNYFLLMNSFWKVRPNLFQKEAPCPAFIATSPLSCLSPLTLTWSASGINTGIFLVLFYSIFLE